VNHIRICCQYLFTNYFTPTSTRLPCEVMVTLIRSVAAVER